MANLTNNNTFTVLIEFEKWLKDWALRVIMYQI